MRIQHVHNFIYLMGIVIMTSVSSLRSSEADYVLLNRQQLLVFTDSAKASMPLTLHRTGAYHVWVYAQQGRSVEFVIDNQVFRTDPASGEGSLYTWKKLGSIQLKKNGNHLLRLTRAESKLQGMGFVYLSTSERNPEDAFEFCQVFPGRPWLLKDGRYDAIRYITSIQQFPEYASLDQWQERARNLKKHLLAALGLFPPPPKTPLNARIFDKTERAGYSVEKVVFESIPGFYVTGNLYRPDGAGPFPGILCPHGHWGEGRLADDETVSVPGRCINFALQGFVTFSYSMVGYNDSKQLLHEDFNQQLSLWGYDLMSLQTWNSIRAVDFVCSLPQVDSTRIGCTGASGGGTQTFMLAAVDERVQVAAPVNMISSVFQGGCRCENAPHLRLDTYNAEIAALMAPKPLLLIACTGDWTRHSPDWAFKDMQKIYALYGKPERIEIHQFDYGHNYNRDSREAVYKWMARWLGRQADWQAVKERPFKAESSEALLAFPDDEPVPGKNAAEIEKELLERARQFVKSSYPGTKTEIEDYKSTMGYLLANALDVKLPVSGRVIKKVLRMKGQGTSVGKEFTADVFGMGRIDGKDVIPSLFLQPEKNKALKVALLHISPRGKLDCFDLEQKAPRKWVADQLQKGVSLLSIDPYGVGEFSLLSHQIEREAQVPNFTTFNAPDLALKIHDIITAIAFLRQSGFKEISVIGCEEAGLWSLLATSMVPRWIDCLVVDVNGFNNTDDDTYIKSFFIAGFRKAGDFSTAAALLAPKRMILHHTANRFETKHIERVYKLLDATSGLSVFENKLEIHEAISQITGK
ncbi:acetylxylan esterase [candidate division KSB1 bacterium]|nr:acetylxylan esterase [candidate division KSB1 bacterium]